MSPRCVKPKCLKRVPIYIPVHRPCLDSLDLPISIPCILPYYNVQSSCIQQNHSVCHCRDQSCSRKVCNPNNWNLSHSHICKSGESNKDINTEDIEQSEQCKILDGRNLQLEEKNENINEVEISSQLHLTSINNKTSNTQEEDFAKRQPLPKMPLNRGHRQSKTSDTIIRNSRDDSRSNVRHVGSTVVPETCCKGVQVSLSSALNEVGPFPQNQLNRTENLSRNNFTSEHTNGREPHSYVTYDNRRESLTDTDHFNQRNMNREGFYNGRNAINPCCQSKYIQATQRDSVDLLNNNPKTSSHNNNFEYPINDNEKRLIRSPRDTYGLDTIRPSVNSPREHLVRTNRNPTEYPSHLMTITTATKGFTPNISPVQSQTDFNLTKNQCNRYSLNDKTNGHGRNDHPNLNDLQSKAGSRQMACLRDIDDDNIPISPNQKNNIFQRKPRCNEPAEQNQPVMFPRSNSGIQKRKLQSKDGLLSETVTSSYKAKACCNHGISELVNKTGNMGPDMSFERQLGKLRKNLDCACSDKGAGRDLKSKKASRDGQIDTMSRVSVGCTTNQGTLKCNCCYPPAFKQFTCAGNINGSCRCDD